MTTKDNETNKKTFKEKLLAVSKSIDHMDKDKTNEMIGYKYLSEAKTKEVFKKAFDREGLLFDFSTIEVREYEATPTSKGNKQFVTIAKGEYNITDVDSDSVAKGFWQGSGIDTGDKGLYKAITGGIKFLLNTKFLVPTGEDLEPEKENAADEAEYIAWTPEFVLNFGKHIGEKLGYILEIDKKTKQKTDKFDEGYILWLIEQKKSQREMKRVAELEAILEWRKPEILQKKQNFESPIDEPLLDEKGKPLEEKQ